MVRFYDPKNEEEFMRVEKVLHDGGIEYFLTEEPERGLGHYQIQVAEEDFPHAESLLNHSLR